MRPSRAFGTFAGLSCLSKVYRKHPAIHARRNSKPTTAAPIECSARALEFVSTLKYVTRRFANLERRLTQ